MAEVEQLGQLVDELETAISARVQRVDASGEVRGWGYPSTSAWLRTRLGTRHARALERVTLARQLPRLAQVAKRLAAGQLSHGYATAIAAGVKYLDDDDTEAAEQILLDLVDDGASVADVAKTCARINDVIAERDGRDNRPRGQRRGYRRSWLSVTTDLDGRGAHVAGWLSATHASMLRQACAPLAVPAGADDPRDQAQRFADALYMRLSQGGRRWSATIVIDTSTLTSGGRPQPAQQAGETGPPRSAQQAGAADPGELADSTGPPAGLAAARIWPGRTPDGLMISADQARAIAVNAGLSALIVGSHGLPLYLGRKTRLVTPAQRKALIALYETCVADGCVIPAYLCQIDHVRQWMPDGLTDIDNLAPQCAFHNRFKSDHPERIELIRRDGRWKYHFRRPPFHRPATRTANQQDPPPPP
jgi:hypothetical protein